MGKYSVDDNALAQRFFQQAIDLDPTFAGGSKGLAIAQAQAAAEFQTRSLPTIQNSVEGLARRAVALDNADAEAHSILSNLLRLRGDHTGALAEAERALAITPNLALAHGVMGATLVFSGRPREVLAYLETSIRLDPRDPYLAARLNQMVLGLYFCGEYEAAIEAAGGVIPEREMLFGYAVCLDRRPEQLVALPDPSHRGGADPRRLGHGRRDPVK